MFENKKLFFTTLVITFLLCAFIDVPLMLLQLVPIGSIAMCLFWMGNGLLGIIAYSFMYKALKKTELIKKIYRFALAIGVMIFIAGFVMLLISL